MNTLKGESLRKIIIGTSGSLQPKAAVKGERILKHIFFTQLWLLIFTRLTLIYIKCLGHHKLVKTDHLTEPLGWRNPELGNRKLDAN